MKKKVEQVSDSLSHSDDGPNPSEPIVSKSLMTSSSNSTPGTSSSPETSFPEHEKDKVQTSKLIKDPNSRPASVILKENALPPKLPSSERNLLRSVTSRTSQVTMGAVKIWSKLTKSASSKLPISSLIGNEDKRTNAQVSESHNEIVSDKTNSTPHEEVCDETSVRDVFDGENQKGTDDSVWIDVSKSPNLDVKSESSSPSPDKKLTKSKRKSSETDEFVSPLYQNLSLLPSRNRVLPSYEEELEPDNTIVSESIQRSWMSGLLHRLNSAYHYVAGNSLSDKPYSVSRTVDLFTFTPHNVRKVAVVGVHGWFPSKLLQRVVGEPVGTSQYFAKKMSEAVNLFFEKRYGIHISPETDMTLIPLEGEGLVEDRVEKLYQQLISNNDSPSWSESVKSADLVLISAHSQGSPVSVMIVSKMMQDGLIDPQRQRVGILCIAGIHHGPFPQLKSSLILRYVESDPARQLFDFNDPTAPITKRYTKALEHILNAGVRFAAIGSWYDQVVPLYSGTLHGVSHPSIYRALYIDASDYQPNFFSHLVVFALSLRNHGLDDHGLIVHISDALAGSIYGIGTQGHYVIYEELNTYLVAVAWFMGRTTTLWNPLREWRGSRLVHKKPAQDSSWLQGIWNGLWSGEAKQAEEKEAPNETPPVFHTKGFSAPSRLNPYHLPWIMSKIIHDPKIQSHPQLSKELQEVIRMFSQWDPGSNRITKDLRYRLDPLKSKL